MAQALAQKNWYSIVAPDMFDETDVITDTPASEEEHVIGRKVTPSLQDVMNTDKYYMDVHLTVNKVEGGRAFTEITGHETSQEYISRMVHRGSKRIDVVEDVETSDGERVRVKIIAVTYKKPNTKSAHDIRETLRDHIQDLAADRDYQAFMQDIFNGSMQQELQDRSGKVYPVQQLEFRKTELQQ